MEAIKVFKVLIIAASEESAKSFTSWISSVESSDDYYLKEYKNYKFEFTCRWPGAPKGQNVSANDAIIIRVKNISEWATIREDVHERTLVQFRFVIWDEEIKAIVEEIKPTLTIGVNEKNNTELLDEFIKADGELDNLLETIFKNFDKSGDGFIDVQEMETLCKEAGVEVTHSEFKETLQSLDVNHDNKISLEEFKDWFKKGRQCTHLMESLISFRIATSSFMNSYLNSKYLQFIQDKLDYLQKVKKELINSFLSVNIEKVADQPNVSVSLDGYFGGEVMETISKSYVQNFLEGLKSTDIFLVWEFTLRDSSKLEQMEKFLKNITDAIRESFSFTKTSEVTK